MANKLTESSVETIQKFIIEGRKILFKEDLKIFVQIRFNPNDTDGSQKWKIIFGGNEFHTKEIFINIPSKTESHFYENLNGFKHHIVCQANTILFEKNQCNIN